MTHPTWKGVFRQKCAKKRIFGENERFPLHGSNWEKVGITCIFRVDLDRSGEGPKWFFAFLGNYAPLGSVGRVGVSVSMSSISLLRGSTVPNFGPLAPGALGLL